MTPPSTTPHAHQPSTQYPPTLPALAPATLPAQYVPRAPLPSAEPFPPAYPEPMRSVPRRPDHTGHTTHLFLTIITAGVWGVIVWLPLTLRHKRRHARRTA